MLTQQLFSIGYVFLDCYSHADEEEVGVVLSALLDEQADSAS